MEQRYLTRRAVAAELGVSRRTLDRWLAAGRLPAVKLGHSVRIGAEDLAAFLAARRLVPPPEEDP